MKRCEHKGEPPDDNECGYELSDHKGCCLYFEKNFWDHNGSGSICTAPPKDTMEKKDG